MIRVFLFFILPIVLPTLMYLGWLYFIRQDDEGEGGKAALVREGPWFSLILAGLALMIIGLISVAVTGGMSPGGVYQAPYAKDGKIIPGRMAPQQEPPDSRRQ